MNATLGAQLFKDAIVSIARNELPEAGKLIETGVKSSWLDLRLMNVHPALVSNLKRSAEQLSQGHSVPGIEQTLAGYVTLLGG